MTTNTTNLPNVVSRDEWLAARKALLAEEKRLTRQRDELNAQRRKLPMVEVEKDYVFAGPNGEVSLLELFEGRCQLIIQHFMFDPGWEGGCPGCTAFVEGLGRSHWTELSKKNTAYVAVSRAPLVKLEAYKQKMGWTFPWVSSYGSDFNYDYHVTLDEAVAPPEYNYRSAAEHERLGTSSNRGEQPGFSFFLRGGNEIYHTYSTFARGSDHLSSTTMFLDLTPLGRQDG